VLGATLIERGAVPAAFSILSPDEFYDFRHAKIYRAIHALFEKGSPVDLITLTEELKGQGELKAIGGAHYLAELTTSVPNAANVEYHARIVAERAVLRRIIEVCASISQQAY